jgi:mannose PTS system EIIA component
MIGILILTHGELGLQFINTARQIGLNSDEGVAAICMEASESPDLLTEKLARAIRSANQGQGVLILTDLLGGTPCNVSLSFLEEGKVEVVTGLNLPMVIKAVNTRENHDLTSLAKSAAEAGKENIFLAGELFRQRLARRRSAEKSS